MADGDLTQQQEPFLTKEEEDRLKHLEFVQGAVLYMIMYLSHLYVLAKEKSGPLKPGVETVEGTVKSVVGPVYDKFHDVPIQVLKYVDRKVGELDRRVPLVIKHVSAQAFSAVQRAPTVAHNVASEVQHTSVKDTATGLAKTVYAKYEPTAKEFYNVYEPKAEQYAVSAWRKLNQLPLFPQVAQVVLPTAAYYIEKYNQTVVSTADEGYRVSLYLPLVPTGKIVKVFSEKEVEPQPLVSD